jgi:hypothetical protein
MKRRLAHRPAEHRLNEPLQARHQRLEQRDAFVVGQRHAFIDFQEARRGADRRLGGGGGRAAHDVLRGRESVVILIARGGPPGAGPGDYKHRAR